MSAHLRQARLCLLVLLLLASACGPAPIPAPTATELRPQATATPPPVPSLWIGDAVPPPLRQHGLTADIGLAAGPESATIVLDVASAAGGGNDGHAGSLSSSWVYALVAPFPTLTDGLTLSELRLAWEGQPPAPFTDSPLLMSASTRAAFRALWGDPAEAAVQVLPPEAVLAAAWESMPSWGIVPFEDLEPRWKVLAVDGQSPARNDFDPSAYPLMLEFSARSAPPEHAALLEDGWPESNRDGRKMTTLVLTGVTALVRFTAITMNAKGILYPGRDIRDWLRGADIAHISNEIPFWGGCQPSREPGRLIFCSDPAYVQLLEDLGADVIELSGDHFGDYGPDATRLTIQIYNERSMRYYGGGLDLADAREPLLLEHNGNKLAFLGCNAKGRGGALAFATENKPGAYPCEFTNMTRSISDLKAEGYLVVSTFQWHESQTYSPLPFVTQIADFRRMADAGATIVSGSQAHSPQTMEFYDGTFIHYGLGNLFFDQMGDLTGQPETVRNEFLDRYTIYAGRLVSIELLTAKLEDYSRPRPMTREERWDFLSDMFSLSGWIAEPSKPTPHPTVTLTPIQLPPPPITPSPP